MDPYLSLVDLVKAFGEVRAVDGVSLDIEKGEFLTLLGPSGCGKTTILRMIAGFTNPTAGHIYLKGERIDDKPPYKRNAGMVFQNLALFPHMTAFENIAYGLKIRSYSKQDIIRNVKEVLEVVQLQGFEDRYPREVSGGQQQRIALARALVIEPDLLLLDEPLSNLDAKLRSSMRLEVKAIQERVGITTVFVTHDQIEALTMSDRLVVMNRGRIMQIGAPTETYERPRSPFVADFIGEANILSGEVTDIAEKEFIVKLEGGGPLVSVARRPWDRIDKAKKVHVCIRPERVHLSTKDERRQNSLSGSLEQLAYVGSGIRHYVRLDFGPRIVVDKTMEELEFHCHVGDKIHVECPRENWILLESE
jgi:spermidine/putrescine ABC transporter ATP-binding subunit